MYLPIKKASAIAIAFLLLSSCIGVDLVFDEIDPELRLMTFVNIIGLDDEVQFKANYFNNVGMPEDVPLEWTSADDSIATVSSSGLVTGKAIGVTAITVSYRSADTELVLNHQLTVADETEMPNLSRSGSIRTTSSYSLTGDFSLTEEEGGELVLEFAENYSATTALPGLFIYLTNNPSTTNGSYEIGPVQVFSGSHSYDLPSSIGLNDYQYVLYFCKPFNVKVGDGRIN